MAKTDNTKRKPTSLLALIASYPRTCALLGVALMTVGIVIGVTTPGEMLFGVGFGLVCYAGLVLVVLGELRCIPSEGPRHVFWSGLAFLTGLGIVSSMALFHEQGSWAKLPGFTGGTLAFFSVVSISRFLSTRLSQLVTAGGILLGLGTLAFGIFLQDWPHRPSDAVSNESMKRVMLGIGIGALGTGLLLMLAVYIGAWRTARIRARTGIDEPGVIAALWARRARAWLIPDQQVGIAEPPHLPQENAIIALAARDTIKSDEDSDGGVV